LRERLKLRKLVVGSRKKSGRLFLSHGPTM